MNRTLLAALLASTALLALPAQAQQVNLYCATGTGQFTTWQPASAANPCPVAATASIAFPTIGAAVPATGVYNGINVAGTLRGLSGLSTGALFPATVAIVDASGVQVTSFGGTNASVGATGAAVPASATYVAINTGGTLVGWTGALAASAAVIGHVIADTGSTTAVTGNVTVVQGTGTNLHVVCDSGCSSSTAPADEATFTPGTTPQSPIGGFFQTTATNNALTNLQMGAWQFTANRAGFVNLRTSAGAEISPALAANQTSVQAPVAAATATATVSVLAGCQYLSALPTFTNTQQGSCIVDVNGRLLTTLASGAPIAPATATATRSNVVGAQYNSTQATFTDGQQGSIQITARGELKIVNMDAAGNARGANVDASNRMSVTVDNVSATNISTNVAQINGVTPLMGNGTTGTGSHRVTLASDGTAISTTGYMSVKFDQTTPGTTNGVSVVPATAGGLSVYTANVTASDNHAVAKAGAGQVYNVSVFNNNAAANYIRLYNATTAFNGCNSATNLVWSGIIPGATTGAGFVVDFSSGIAFSTGISVCVTGAFGNTDTTNAVTNTSINIAYK